MIPNDPQPPSAPDPVPGPDYGAELAVVAGPPATDKSTVQLVLIVLAVIAVLLYACAFVLIYRVIGQTDPAQQAWSLAVIGLLATPATGIVGVLGGSLINTRTPQG